MSNFLDKRHDVAFGVSEPVNKTRLESFSDGVFAIVITLLILNVRVPDGRTLTLQSLGPMVPPHICAEFHQGRCLLGRAAPHASLRHPGKSPAVVAESAAAAALRGFHPVSDLAAGGPASVIRWSCGSMA